MRVRITAVTGTFATALAFGSIVLCASPAQADPGGPADRVPLCHETGSSTNPFVDITVGAPGAYNGHDAQHDGDVIDPTTDDCGSDEYPAPDTPDVPADDSGAGNDGGNDGGDDGGTPAPSPAPDGPTVVDGAVGAPPAAAPNSAPVAPSAAPVVDEAPVTAADDADGESADSDLPNGGVEAGDGSSAEDGQSLLPQVLLGGLALTGAAGAAYAARRSSRSKA